MYIENYTFRTHVVPLNYSRRHLVDPINFDAFPLVKHNIQYGVFMSFMVPGVQG